MQEQELFETYELKGWQLSTRLYQVVGISLVFNLVMFVFMAQANFLTGKTCDSPIASGVCSVLDTLYVGGLILDTDATFVSKPYERTEIGEGDEITYINVGDYQPLTYPEGYFAQANPDQVLFDPTVPAGEIPGISTNPTNDLMNSPQVLPKDPNGAVFDGKLEDIDPLGSETQAKTTTKNNSRNNKLNKKDNTAKTDSKTTSEPVTPGEINRVPFEDLGDEINAKLEKNEVDLTKNFTVVIEGTINADGKFDQKKTKVIKTEGDQQMIDFARRAIEAMGDSGFLGLLKEKNISKVNITLAQNDDEMYAILLSDMKTPELAGTAMSFLNTALSAAKAADESGLKKLDENSRTLVNNSTVKTEGKNFRLDFKIPKQDAQNILRQTLDKRAQTKSTQPKSSGAVNNNTNATMAK